MQKLDKSAIDAAKAIDLVALIGRTTELRHTAAKEWSGACPRCGGDDRLHCTETWWFCRQCHEKRGDAIEFVRWHKGLSFRDAIRELASTTTVHAARPQEMGLIEFDQTHPAHSYMTSNAARPARPAAQTARPAEQLGAWSKRCEALVAAGVDRLWSAAGVAGRDYLASRSIAEHAWLAWGLGLADAWVPGTQTRATAILLPWRSSAGQLVAIRYRFLAGTPKMTAEPGSSFSGRLFGAQRLPAAADPVGHRTLLVCEGEFNALSIWQVTHDSGLDVVSLGSESAALSDSAVQFAQRYGRVIVWADKPTVAQRLMQQMAGAYGLASPDGQDANDLHQRGQLGGFMVAARADAASCLDELLRLVWDMRDAADVLAGIDTSSALATQALATKLGVNVNLVEPEPGRWIPKERLQ